MYFNEKSEEIVFAWWLIYFAHLCKVDYYPYLETRINHKKRKREREREREREKREEIGSVESEKLRESTRK